MTNTSENKNVSTDFVGDMNELMGRIINGYRGHDLEVLCGASKRLYVLLEGAVNYRTVRAAVVAQCRHERSAGDDFYLIDRPQLLKILYLDLDMPLCQNFDDIVWQLTELGLLTRVGHDLWTVNGLTPEERQLPRQEIPTPEAVQ